MDNQNDGESILKYVDQDLLNDQMELMKSMGIESNPDDLDIKIEFDEGLSLEEKKKTAKNLIAPQGSMDDMVKSVQSMDTTITDSDAKTIIKNSMMNIMNDFNAILKDTKTPEEAQELMGKFIKLSQRNVDVNKLSTKPKSLREILDNIE